MFTQLPAGVLASMLAAGLVWILALLSTTVFIPWLRSLFYTGPDLSGDWKGFDDATDAAEHVSNATVRQRGGDVEIEIVRFKRRSDHTPTKRRLRYKGQVSAGTLITLYEDVEMKGFIVGAMVMTLSTDGRMLSGRVVYYDKNKGHVVAPEYVLRRAT